MAKKKVYKAKIYPTYSFTGKDPVIADLKALAGESGMTNVDISKQSAVSAGTLGNWFNGPTRRPQYATVMAVYRALGVTLVRQPYGRK